MQAAHTPLFYFPAGGIAPDEAACGAGTRRPMAADLPGWVPGWGFTGQGPESGASPQNRTAAVADATSIAYELPRTGSSVRVRRQASFDRVDSKRAAEVKKERDVRALRKVRSFPKPPPSDLLEHGTVQEDWKQSSFDLDDAIHRLHEEKKSAFFGSEAARDAARIERARMARERAAVAGAAARRAAQAAAAAEAEAMVAEARASDAPDPPPRSARNHFEILQQEAEHRFSQRLPTAAAMELSSPTRISSGRASPPSPQQGALARQQAWLQNASAAADEEPSAAGGVASSGAGRGPCETNGAHSGAAAVD